MEGFSPLALLGFVWTAVTVVLLALVIYRAVVGIHEENQIFLDRAEAALEKEQLDTLRRIRALDSYIKYMGVLSGVLLLILAGIWVYRGIYAPPM
ncbi:MAG: hypothetical protein HYX72_05655 [Acidobacteria bacterium]|nr:hypothetical protein [Acidobacteriota bacterium]